MLALQIHCQAGFCHRERVCALSTPTPASERADEWVWMGVVVNLREERLRKWTPTSGILPNPREMGRENLRSNAALDRNRGPSLHGWF